MNIYPISREEFMVTVTPGTNCWHVHVDGKLICTTADERLAHDVAAASRRRADAENPSELAGPVRQSKADGTDSSLKDEKANA
jgi:hypothetical protein